MQTRIPLVSLVTDKPVEVFETTPMDLLRRTARPGWSPDRDFVALAELAVLAQPLSFSVRAIGDMVFGRLSCIPVRGVSVIPPMPIDGYVQLTTRDASARL